MKRFEITCLTDTNALVFYTSAEDSWLAYWDAAALINRVEPKQSDICIVVREAAPRGAPKA